MVAGGGRDGSIARFSYHHVSCRGLCAPKPSLYPNGHLQQVGKEVADRDIDECRAMAKDAGATASQGKSGQVASNTAAGGAIGSVPGQWVVQWLVIQDAAQWSEQPVVRRQDFCQQSHCTPEKPESIPHSELD
jgi:hypothetical protein